MRRSVELIVVVLALIAMSLWSLEAWARVGGGFSSGSRGSRSYSAPSRPSPITPSTPSRQSAAPAPQSPQRPGGFFGGMMGGLGGLLLGGLIGSMLFGGFGGGLFGGIGLFEILLIGGGIFLLMSYLRRRQPQPELAGVYGAASWQPQAQSSVMAEEVSSARSDLDQGIRHIHQMDPAFDPLSFQETASDLFFKIQAGWTHREIEAVKSLLTDEMRAGLQRDADRLKAERRINRLENIAVRSSEVTEAWQELGSDFVTVRFLASLLDYTVDEAGGALLEGSKDEPVKFEEYWTFTRSVGSKEWKLAAIQQP